MTDRRPPTDLGVARAREACSTCGQPLPEPKREPVSPAPKAPRRRLPDHACHLGETLARIAREDRGIWDAERAGLGKFRAQFSRRYRGAEVEGRGGPPAVLFARLWNTHPELVRAAAGRSVRIQYVAGSLQLDPNDDAWKAGT